MRNLHIRNGDQMVCRFCGENLVIAKDSAGRGAYYAAPDRKTTPRSEISGNARVSECVTKNGTLTLHDPVR